MAITEYKIGMIVRMKKAHPCGSANWKITRVGMDIGLKCCGCGHYIMLPRTRFSKAVKEIMEEPEK